MKSVGSALAVDCKTHVQAILNLLFKTSIKGLFPQNIGIQELVAQILAECWKTGMYDNQHWWRLPNNIIFFME